MNPSKSINVGICVVAPGGNTTPYLVLPVSDHSIDASGTKACTIFFELIGMSDGWAFPSTSPFGINFFGTNQPSAGNAQMTQISSSKVMLSYTPSNSTVPFPYHISVNHGATGMTLTLDPTIKESSSTVDLDA